MKAYRIKVIGTQHSRQMQEMHLVCYLHFDDEKCKRPQVMIDAIKDKLEAIVIEYMESPDYCDHKEIFHYSRPD